MNEHFRHSPAWNGKPVDLTAATNIAFEDPAEAKFFRLQLIRTVETTLLRLFSENKLYGTTHTSIGQEANAVAVMEALDLSRDIVWSNHRCHGHFIAYCGNVIGLIAEIMGRVGGVCGGRGGSQHLCYRNFYSNGIQGGTTPLAVGCALSEKETGTITAVFIGDGTLGEGTLYESLNLASLGNAPVLFVVENNGIAQTTPASLGLSGEPWRRAESFGIDCVATASTDVEVLTVQAKDITRRIRTSSRPIFWHIDTVRLGPHSKGDDTRSEKELALLYEKDPLPIQRARLQDPDSIEHLCAAIVDEAVRQALVQDEAGGEIDR